MLNMGFTESIDEILAGVPAERNTLLFSSYHGQGNRTHCQELPHRLQRNRCRFAQRRCRKRNHIYYLVHAKDKYAALKRVVDYFPRIYGIIFCRTRIETQEIADLLIRDGYNAEALHGDLSQAQRDLTMQKFRQHHTQLLVATDA